MERFAYEEAEKLLDQFADGPRFAAFQRAYRKFKHMVMAYAYIDYMNGSRLKDKIEQERAISYAWEDAQMGFAGHGEGAMTGMIIQLWSSLDTKEHDLFFEVVKTAFERAEAATPATVPRRYLIRHRTKKPRRPEQNFDLPVILPVSGVKLRDWAKDHGKNPDEIEEQWRWLEFADRLPDEKEVAVAGGQGTPRRPKLTLVKNED